MPTARDLIEEGIRYEAGGVADRALDAYREAAESADQARDRAEALRRTADVLRSRCDWTAAIDAANASANVARDHGLSDLLAEAINAEAGVHQSMGRFDRAGELYERMLALTDHPRIRGIALQNLGSIAAVQGNFDAAEAHFTDSFECFQMGGYQRGLVIALNNWGCIALDRRMWEDARGILESGERRARELMDLDLLALVRINLAEALFRTGAIDTAQDLASAALGFFGNTQNDRRKIDCLRLMGDIAMAQEQTDSARNMWHAAIGIAERIDAAPEAATLRERLAVIPI